MEKVQLVQTDGAAEPRQSAGRATFEDHVAALDAVRAEAYAVPRRLVRDPKTAVRLYIGEASKLALQARADEALLLDARLPPDAVTKLQRTLDALGSAQIVLEILHRGGGPDGTSALVEEARALRRDAFAFAELAFRERPGARKQMLRLKALGERRSLLPEVLAELMLLLSMERDVVAGHGFDLEVQGRHVVDVSARLRDALVEHSVMRASASTRDLRNRLFALSLTQIAELRAFATYVFRNEPARLLPYRIARRCRPRSRAGVSPGPDHRPEGAAPATRTGIPGIATPLAGAPGHPRPTPGSIERAPGS